MAVQPCAPFPVATPDQLDTLRGIFARVTGLAATDARITPYVPLIADHYWDEGAPTAPNDIADIIRADYRDYASSLVVPTLSTAGGPPANNLPAMIATDGGSLLTWGLIALVVWYLFLRQ